MRLLGVLLCSLAATGAAAALPTAAQAEPLRCTAGPGQTVTLVEQPTACSAQADPMSSAFALGSDGIGYAKAVSGATTFGAGLAGGLGAAQGGGGVVLAAGIGRDAVALADVDHASLAVAIALPGSQAAVAETGARAVCVGNLSFALNAGRACLGTWTAPLA